MSSLSSPSAATSARPVQGSMSGLLLGIGFVALIVVGVGVVARPALGWSGLLIAGFYGVAIVIGASLLAAISAVSGARWWIPIRRVPALIGRTLPAPAVALVATFVLGLTAIYPWADHATMEASHLLHQKAAWLNVPFFLARAGLLILIFFVLTRGLFAGASGRGLPSPGRAAGFIVAFGLSISVASWDWMMSLEPEWFSTMYGVYGFSGAFVGGIAAVAIVALVLHRRGLAGVKLDDRQIHDLGSLLFGFSFFWGYIWFCQYMLIWYANIPEETPHYARRLSQGWGMLFWLNPIVNFIIPFLALLSSRAKRHAPTLLQVAGIVIAGRWLDTYLMVAPALEESPSLPIFAAAATVAVLAGMVLLGQRALSRSST